MKKLISSLLLVAVVVFIAGCEKDEIKVQRHVEVRDHVVSQDTIVD